MKLHLLLLALLLVSILIVFQRASNSRSLGDQYLAGDVPDKALEQYAIAQKQWPLYRFDKSFQQQRQKAEEHPRRGLAVVIFLEDDVTTSDKDSLISEIEALNGIKMTKFISQEEAFKKYQETNKNDPQLLQSVTNAIEFMPVRIEVYLDDFSLEGKIVELAKNKPFVAGVTGRTTKFEKVK